MMGTPLSLSTGRRDDGTVQVSAAGELDLSNVAVFTQAIEAALSAPSHDSGRVTIDLSGVEYLDSGAINALFDHVNHIREIIANPTLMPVLKVSGLTDVTPVQAASRPSTQ
jgi:anti-anti-sigma factor